MKARVVATYVADNPDMWRKVYEDSDPEAEFLSFIRDEVSNIDGGVSADRVDIWMESDVVLKTAPGARWAGPDQATTVDDNHDPVNHPKHYTGHPSGVECITVTEHMNFCLGNAVKYIWRAGEKGNTVEDLEKAVWYLQREIARIGDSETGTEPDR